MSYTPIIYEWDGEAMRPLARFHTAANAQFVIGERYNMAAEEERSARSHNHYFAALHEYWLNLPEHEADRFPTETHFRKHCLIVEGYRDERTFVASSKAEALRLAAFVKPLDEYSIVVVRECVVVVWTAQSQSKKAMGPKVFGESKQKVLDRAASMIGVAREPDRAPPIGEAA